MPRQPRLVVPGTALHVIQRGNNRMRCFLDGNDYSRYLLYARELAEKHGCTVHAYCLMPNHVHLLMTPLTPEACAMFMRTLGQRYVQYFNRRYGRTGTLWEGRFRSCIVDSAHYVLACYRYIEMNPVRPGLADRPDDYEWSSHAINIGRRADGMITPHAEFLALGIEAEARYRAYRELVGQALEPSVLSAIRTATSAGERLGAWGRSRAPSPVLGFD